MENITENQIAEPSAVTGSLIAVAVVTALVLMVPLVAMRFTDEVNWTLGDFVVAAILLFGTGAAYVLAVRKVPSKKKRVLIGAALGLTFLFLWAEMAVGIIGTLPFSGS